MKPSNLLPLLTAATLFLTPGLRAVDATSTPAAPPSNSAPSPADVQAQKRADFIKRFDTNGDGKLDPAERAAAKAARTEKREERAAKMQARMLKRYDKNGDGKLDDAEQTAALADMETRPRFIKRFDKNDDGVLSPEEKATAEATMRAVWNSTPSAPQTPQTPQTPATPTKP